ncbi:hypothetical protein [Streptobacillus moniliformis]|uniref:hypothetical protein n=1 Tax=Streptobacillus moniliformis TaxID=34105 RepID=UPI0007E38385|nr:hypothetical protein [Streptobacillus moniliformis]
MKEDVLKVEVTKINDEYSVYYISYQNEEVLKRGRFEDEDLGVYSINHPLFNGFYLHLRGENKAEDYTPLIIHNTIVSLLQKKVKQINEKYGIEKLGIKRVKKGETYCYITDDFYAVKGKERNDITDNSRYNSKNYFTDAKECMACLEYLTEELIKFRKEWRKKYPLNT